MRNVPDGQELDGNLQVMTFDDVDYRHRYGVNHEQSSSHWKDLWTGTSYQVKLDYRKDFVTSQSVNLFANVNREAKNKRLRELGLPEITEENKMIEPALTCRGVQFHFHSPSEHTIDGRQFDLELHIVHKLMYV